MKLFQKGISILVTVAIPFFLVMTMIRLLFQPVFLRLEYQMPGFPPDPYGFTLGDRIKWGTVSLQYLFNDQGISFLGDQQLPDGTSLFNERELSHMVDVKVFIQSLVKSWIGLTIGLVLIFVWAWRGKWLGELGRAYLRGGWLTLGLIAAILVSLVINFDALFTAFHRIFFQGDTWLFLYSDSLIRLLPERLWQDLFIAVGFLTVLGGVGFILVGKRLARKNA